MPELMLMAKHVDPAVPLCFCIIPWLVIVEHSSSEQQLLDTLRYL